MISDLIATLIFSRQIVPSDDLIQYWNYFLMNCLLQFHVDVEFHERAILMLPNHLQHFFVDFLSNPLIYNEKERTYDHLKPLAVKLFI